MILNFKLASKTYVGSVDSRNSFCGENNTYPFHDGVGGPAVPPDQVSPGHASLGSYVPRGLLSLGPNVLFRMTGPPHVYSTVHCACAHSIDWQAPNGILVATPTNKLTLRDTRPRGGAHLS